MKKNLLQYSLNVAATLAELYSKNKSYKDARFYLPKQGINITKNFKERVFNYHNLSPNKPVLIVVNGLHKTLN